MDMGESRVLRLIFPDGVPDNVRDSPECSNYLSKLGTYKAETLKREEARLADNTKRIIEKTEELAISNYKTFIDTAENSRSISEEFQKAEEQICILINKIPTFSKKCEEFLENSHKLYEERHLNSTILEKNAQLLEILELPQLMERCIHEGRYEEALELANFVQKLGLIHGDITVVANIVKVVEGLWHKILVQLVAQLRTDLQLPRLLEIVGHLRHMEAFSSNELKLKFLQARGAWLTSTLQAIPRTDDQQHLIKTIEITRVNIFNIVTQYRAIFPHGLPADDINNPLHSVNSSGDHLFDAWLHAKIDDFLVTLEEDLQHEVNSYDTVLGQCMYFGLSLSRVGADFRGLMVPIFVRAMRTKFQANIEQINTNFKQAMQKYTLINKKTLHSRKSLHTSEVTNSNEKPLTPPETLLDFYPLAELCNGYLNASNELRLCTPIALCSDVTQHLQQSLEFVAHCTLSLYRQEQQAFKATDRDTFAKFCLCISSDLIPFVQSIIHALFPPHLLTAQLGISLLMFEEENITLLDASKILKPLKDILPFIKSDGVSYHNQIAVTIAE